MYTRYTNPGVRHTSAVLVFLLALIPLSGQIRAGDEIQGDAAKGRALAAGKCDRCHGEGGVSDDPDTPHLAGQSAAYLLKQLQDYKSRARDDRNMYKRARKLDEQQMADLSLWYESQPLPALNPDAAQGLEAPELVTHGDTARSIPPCEICHGKDGRTVANVVPALAGQYADYLVSTMEYFSDGTRSNDPGGAISLIISKLTDLEIDALARYYAALGGRPAQ